MARGTDSVTKTHLPPGRTSKEIATQLGVSPKTDETHRASLMDKPGIHKASSLVRFAIREGLVTA